MAVYNREVVVVLGMIGRVHDMNLVMDHSIVASYR